jgi:hypothetical protein
MSEIQAGASGAQSRAPTSAGRVPSRTLRLECIGCDEIAASSDEFKNHFKIRVVDNSSRRIRASALIQRRYAWRGYSTSPLERHIGGRVTLSACVEEATVATITAGP